MIQTFIVTGDVTDFIGPVYNPNAPGDVVVGTGPIVIWGPYNVARFDKKSFFLKNTGAVAFNSCTVQWTRIEIPASQLQQPLVSQEAIQGVGPQPSITASDWVTVDSATFATLAAGAVKDLTVSGDAKKWMRIIATVAAGTTTAKAFCVARTI